MPLYRGYLYEVLRLFSRANVAFVALYTGREFARFIAAVENLPNEVTEFEESMWSDLVESMTVYAKDDIRFILPCETEIKA